MTTMGDNNIKELAPDINLNQGQTAREILPRAVTDFQ